MDWTRVEVCSYRFFLNISLTFWIEHLFFLSSMQKSFRSPFPFVGHCATLGEEPSFRATWLIFLAENPLLDRRSPKDLTRKNKDHPQCSGLWREKIIQQRCSWIETIQEVYLKMRQTFKLEIKIPLLVFYIFNAIRQTRRASWFSLILHRFFGQLSVLLAGWWYGRTTRLKSRNDSADFPALCIASSWNLTQRPFVCPVQRRRLEVSPR